MHGLNEYDFSARWQDAAVPGFTTPDPLAENHYSDSPYSYCGGDPVNRVDLTGLEWYWNDDGQDPVWIDGDADVDGYDNHNTDCYKQAGQELNYNWVHYGTQDYSSQDYTNEAMYAMYGFVAPTSGDHQTTSVVGSDGNSNQNSNNEAKVVSSFSLSDPNSNRGADGSYNLYTANQTKTAERVMLAIGTGGLALETGTAGALGEVVANAKIIPVIQAVAGAVEGAIKAYFGGPDAESSSSVFMNPVSDASMNIMEAAWTLGAGPTYP